MSRNKLGSNRRWDDTQREGKKRDGEPEVDGELREGLNQTNYVHPVGWIKNQKRIKA